MSRSRPRRQPGPTITASVRSPRCWSATGCRTWPTSLGSSAWSAPRTAWSGANHPRRTHAAGESPTRARGARADVHQARPAAVHEADLLSPDNRAELSEAAGRGAGGSERGGQGHRRARAACARGRGVCRLCSRAARVRVGRAGPRRDAARRHRRSREGARPNVVEDMEQDFEIIQNLAARASRRSKTAARYDVVGLADEFVHTLRHSSTTSRRRATPSVSRPTSPTIPSVQIPRVFPDLTTSRVITLERIRGMKITDLTALDEAGLDHHALAERTALIVAKMIFEDGFFHADPHPGNFFIEPTGRVGIVDFGMVGNLDDRLREQLSRLLSGFLRRDPGRLADALLALGTSTGVVDRARLREDVAALLGRYTSAAASVRSRCEAPSAKSWTIVRRHRLGVPRDLSLLFTMLIIAEGIVAELDPEFRFAEALAPYARRQLLSGANCGRCKAPPGAARPRPRGADRRAADPPQPHHRGDRDRWARDPPAHRGHGRAARRPERLGNRFAASVLPAALIDGVVQLAARRRRHRPGPAGARQTASAKLGALVRPSRRRR